jgi:hypothetical protein
MNYGHFGRINNRLEFLKANPPLELVFIIKTGVTYGDNINIHDLEDYVTVVVSKKYGADNVYGGFRLIKSPSKRIKFVEEYNCSANRQTVNIIDPLIDFELPEIYEIKDSLFGEYKPRSTKRKMYVNQKSLCYEN